MHVPCYTLPLQPLHASRSASLLSLLPTYFIPLFSFALQPGVCTTPYTSSFCMCSGYVSVPCLKPCFSPSTLATLQLPGLFLLLFITLSISQVVHQQPLPLPTPANLKPCCIHCINVWSINFFTFSNPLIFARDQKIFPSKCFSLKHTKSSNCWENNPTTISYWVWLGWGQILNLFKVYL